MSLIIYITLIFESFLVYMPTASYVHTVYQNISASIPQRNLTRFARQSRDLNYFGNRINMTTLSGEPLLANEPCTAMTRSPEYDYLLKEEIIVTKFESWGVFLKIPICAKDGSSFEIVFTPRTGWTMFLITLFNADFKTPLKKFILPGDNLIEDNVRASLVIEVQDNSFQLYINDEAFVNVPYVPEIQHFPIYLQIYAPHVEFLYVMFKSAEEPFPTL